MRRYLEVKLQLIKKIGQLEPGERIPSRPLLCRQLGTNRTTLDRAIKELESEGVLASRKGSGTYALGAHEEKVGKAESWGVIVPNVMDYVYPSLVRGIENVACRCGANVILCNSDDDAEKQNGYIRRLLQSGVAGFAIVPVITSSARMSAALYGVLLNSKIPFVFCHRGVEGIRVPLVKSNDFYGGYIATKHLLVRGYRGIAYIAKLEYSTSVERYQGYVSALQEFGLEVNPIRVFLPCEEKPNGSYQYMASLIERDPELDAAFCFNDYVAREVCNAIHDSGKRVSSDIGVIGYDNLPEDSLAQPKITSLSFKSIEIGELAAEILHKEICGMDIGDCMKYCLVQPEIVVRESCLEPEKQKEKAYCVLGEEE